MSDGKDGSGFRIGVSSLLGFAVTLGGYYAAHLDGRIGKTEGRIDDLSKNFYERGQRLSALESHYADLSKRVDQTAAAVDKRLDRIEQKIDILIGERGRR